MVSIENIFFSSSYQQCGVCDDVSTTHSVVENDGDTITTCSIVVRQIENVDEWGETTKSFKIVDISDVSVAFKGARCQCYKTFYGRNLRIFVLS